MDLTTDTNGTKERQAIKRMQTRHEKNNFKSGSDNRRRTSGSSPEIRMDKLRTGKFFFKNNRARRLRMNSEG